MTNGPNRRRAERGGAAATTLIVRGRARLLPFVVPEPHALVQQLLRERAPHRQVVLVPRNRVELVRRPRVQIHQVPQAVLLRASLQDGLRAPPPVRERRRVAELVEQVRGRPFQVPARTRDVTFRGDGRRRG